MLFIDSWALEVLSMILVLISFFGRFLADFISSWISGLGFSTIKLISLTISKLLSKTGKSKLLIELDSKELLLKLLELLEIRLEELITVDDELKVLLKLDLDILEL